MEKYGSVVKGVLGGKLYVFLSDPRDIELILNSQTHIDKAPEYSFFKPWLGDGLLISTGNLVFRCDWSHFNNYYYYYH